MRAKNFSRLSAITRNGLRPDIYGPSRRWSSSKHQSKRSDKSAPSLPECPIWVENGPSAVVSRRGIPAYPIRGSREHGCHFRRRARPLVVSSILWHALLGAGGKLAQGGKMLLAS